MEGWQAASSYIMSLSQLYRCQKHHFRFFSDYAYPYNNLIRMELESSNREYYHNVLKK
jgi:hypothetical protein